MALSNEPTFFELASVAASTYEAMRVMWWWANGTHPTASNSIAYECLECWDGTLREAPLDGLLSNLTSGHLWLPSASPSGPLPTGSWGVFRSQGGLVAAKCVFFVRMEASGQAGVALVPLDDWTIGGGSGASPTLPATIIGQPATGDGDGRFPSSASMLWSMIMDEGMIIIKQYPASGLLNRWTYMGEVDTATREADDPRPFITPRNTSQSWSGSYSHLRRSPVDDSTLVELRNRPFYQETMSVAGTYDDLGPQYLSNVALDSSEPIGHRYIQGFFRNVGACDETMPANRATAGYTGSDYRFEVFSNIVSRPHMVTLYPPGTPLSGGHTIVTEASVPTQLIPLFVPPPAAPVARALNVIRHLLPKSRPWNLVYLRQFVQFMRGTTPALDDAANNSDTIWTDIFPPTASEAAIINWERQFALGQSSSLTLDERRERLAGVWSSVGGQSPGYITSTLQAHGFAVQTHEWWDLSSSGWPVPKDPRDHLLPEFGGTDTDGRLLVNIIRTAVKFDIMVSGEVFAESGEPRALSGYYGGYTLDQVGFSYVGPETYHPYYLYIGGTTFPDVVDIPVARKEEFEKLCQQICPAQQWLVLRVRYI